MCEQHVIKIGKQGCGSDRQKKHARDFPDSELLEVFECSCPDEVEKTLKEIFKNKDVLCQGKPDLANTGNWKEIVIVKDQDDYANMIREVNNVIAQLKCSDNIQFQVEMERTKQIESKERAISNVIGYLASERDSEVKLKALDVFHVIIA